MTSLKPNEFRLVRIYNAPVADVWEAWVDPTKVAQWWGPRGFTLTTQSKDVRVGGRWIYTMHGPDGVDYPNNTLFFEVEKHAKLVYDHGANETQPPIFRVTALFSEQQGQTTMDLTFACVSAEAAVEIQKFVRQAFGNSTWDRLEEFLSTKDCFVINHSFATSIENLFKIWTEPEHIKKWSVSNGSSMEFMRYDLSVGGTTFYSSKSDQGMVLFGKNHYLEIEKPHRLVYTQIFCDQNENIARHPLAPTWPETMLTTIYFASEGEEQTRVTIRWEIYGDATQAERDTFHSAKTGMMHGWTGSFENLENYLSSK